MSSTARSARGSDAIGRRRMMRSFFSIPCFTMSEITCVVSKPSGEMYVFMVVVLFGFCGINARCCKRCVIAIGFIHKSPETVAGRFQDRWWL